jgi:tRNA-2-methylthio-N6-dimethylallyladenosine synthase
MNRAESDRISSLFTRLGFDIVSNLKSADVVLLNTCVVRQHAEDKIYGMLGYLSGMKKRRPGLSILVTGCLVGSDQSGLQKRFPHVDLFFKPGSYEDVAAWSRERGVARVDGDNELLPERPGVATFVPIIQGCINFCSFCVVPYRRGREKSRTMDAIVCEVTELVRRGTREVTLLGQNVNSYGHDLPDRPSLANLLTELNGIPELTRIRFLTNHPKDMGADLIDAMAFLDKVCESVNLPLQSGDDEVLKAMRRSYTSGEFLNLVRRLRDRMPDMALTTDLIVGFPGETDDQFQNSLRVIEEVRFDLVHSAPYSSRPGTLASREMSDSVPAETKQARLNVVEELQTKISTEKNAMLLGKTEDVLVEGKGKGKWWGRTRRDRLVFFESDLDCYGSLLRIRIAETSPWSLQGQIVV